MLKGGTPNAQRPALNAQFGAGGNSIFAKARVRQADAGCLIQESVSSIQDRTEGKSDFLTAVGPNFLVLGQAA